MSAQTVLDACCGPRMMWFDKRDERCLFVDHRSEEHTITAARGATWGKRSFSIRPDLLANFEALPFPDDSFPLVAFDPPHINHGGAVGFMVKKYGLLGKGWREVLRHGFAECFRVLQPLGTLVFKWSECDIPVRDVLALTPRRPLFGQRCGAKARTHWIVFQKEQLP